MITYEIISPISESDKSKVYLATCENYDEPIVLKKVKGMDMSLFKRIQKIHNPHIPKIYDVTIEEDTVIILEEYVSGVDLGTYISEKHVDRHQVVSLMLQICDGVACLHAQTPPIIHRDLKPSNLIVTEDGVVKVIDFDASREYKSGAKKDTRILGTAEYAPPEQYGYSQTTEQSDIYALGVILKEITRELSDVSGLDSVIEKATMFNPDARYGSVREMADAISSAGSDRLVKKKAWTVIAVIVVILAGFGIYRYLGYGNGHIAGEKVNGTNTAVDAATAGAVSETDQNINEYKITIVGENNTKSVYDYVFYYVKSAAFATPCCIYNFTSAKEKATAVQIRKADMGGTSEIDSRYWYQDDDDFIHLTDDFFETLDEDAEYILSVRYSSAAITFHCKVVSDTQNLINAQIVINPGYVEYLRTDPGDIKLALGNVFGRKITKIVDTETKKNIDEKYYDIDYDNGFLTIYEELLEGVEDGAYLNYTIHYEKIDGISNQSSPLTICVRDKAYVSPVLAKKDFTLQLNDMEDLQLDVTWNSGRGKLEAIYSYPEDAYEEEPDTIPKKMYKVTKQGVTIRKKYLKKLGKGSYQYMLEFGDVGLRFHFTIN
jgi:serine/threonine protein kinase